MKLINLHNNTEYSFLQSTLTIDKLVSNAVSTGDKYLAITDHNNMFGLPLFLKKCKENNINPIIGLDLDVETYRLILIAKNYQGYLELARLSNLKMSEQFIELFDIDSTHLLVIDHPTLGFYAKNQRQLSIENYFIVANNPHIPNAIWVKEHRVFNSNENVYLTYMHAIENGEELSFNFQGINEEVSVDSEIISRTNNLIKQINVEFPHNPNPLPKFANNLGLTSFDYLKEVLKEAIVAKTTELKKYHDFKQRLQYELNVINELGFSDYFLVIWDFIKWAKEKGIVIGPGRGSAAGSLICYLLNITEVNPLKYNLLFERFLNPKRISMPDIDIDIQDTRREEIIDYLFEKYGKNNVALIVTFSTLGAKMALRDVARVMKIPLTEVNEITKMLPLISTLEDSFANITKFRTKIQSTATYQKLFDVAKFLEGFPRQTGTHAAGIIISDQKINNLIPTMILSTGRNQTQFSMDYLETFGLLKIDLLGLKNLTSVNDILKAVNLKNHTNLKMEDIPLNNIKTNALLSNGKTVGIFQLESPGMIQTLKKVGVHTFDDIPAIISLFRPGPMQNIPLYIKHKKGQEKIAFVSEAYNKILESTYGIIVYQEQIMEICQQVAGMDFSEADILRKAISKKDFSEIEPIKKLFCNGALKKGYDLQTVETIFALIEKFAEYGFNKSHAYSYGMLSYRMAYLKSEYPADFFTSVINSSHGVQATIEKFALEALGMGFKIKTPSVNQKTLAAYSENNTIFLPLIMIKGFGEAALKKLSEEREKNGIFTSFLDFVLRAKLISLGEANIQLLIAANALKEFGNIKTLQLAYTTKIDSAIEISISKDKVTGEKIADHSIINREIEYHSEILDVAYEKSLEEKHLGFSYNYLNQSAINNEYEIDTKIADIEQGKGIVLAVVVEKIDIFNDKHGREMARLTLSDSSKVISVLLFSSQWPKFIELQKDRIVYFKIFYDGVNYKLDANWKFAK